MTFGRVLTYLPTSHNTEIGIVLFSASSRYISIDCHALCCKWFSQLHFHFSYQPTNKLSINYHRNIQTVFWITSRI